MKRAFWLDLLFIQTLSSSSIQTWSIERKVRPNLREQPKPSSWLWSSVAWPFLRKYLTCKVERRDSWRQNTYCWWEQPAEASSWKMLMMQIRIHLHRGTGHLVRANRVQHKIFWGKEAPDMSKRAGNPCVKPIQCTTANNNDCSA